MKFNKDQSRIQYKSYNNYIHNPIFKLLNNAQVKVSVATDVLLVSCTQGKMNLSICKQVCLNFPPTTLLQVHRRV